jgi:hypothetical protein
MREYLRLCYTVNFNLFIISIAVLENVPPDVGLQKRAIFSTLIVGLAGDRSRATCGARSGANRSAIHYDLVVDKSVSLKTRLKFLISHNPRGNTVITLKSKSVSHT